MRIRTRLLLLIVLATVPLAAVQLYNELRLRSEQEQDVRQTAMATAKLVSYDLARLVSSVELLLASMSHSGVALNRPQTCNSYMVHLSKSFPLASNVGISDAGGHVLCLNSPFKRGSLKNGDRLYFRRAVENGRFSVGEFMVGRATGRRVLAFGAPIYSNGDPRKLIGVAYASIDLDRLADELLQRPLPPNSSITIADSDGTIMVRTPERGRVGQRLPPRWMKMLDASKPGVMTNEAIFGGTPRILAYTPLPSPTGGLFVAIGLDAQASMADINSATKRTFSIMGFVLFGSIMLTLLLGRYSIRKPLDRILRAVNRWKGGDFTARTGLTGKSTEFMEIGQTFDEMAQTLSAHETERDAAERALRRSRDQAARASASKTQFLASASHDLRQPLQTLCMTAALLSGRSQRDDDPAHIAILQRAVDSLAAMVDGMMDVAQLDAGLITPKLTSVDVGTLIRSLEDEFAGTAEEQGITLRMEPCEGHVHSDPMLLGRIMRNLLSNAVKFTPRGGAITLSCKDRDDRLDITVRDTGIGIPAERHGQIFEEFQQLNNPERDRRKGLGLGLSIVQKLAELLDHPVSLASEPGKGSAFTVSVPRAAAPLSPALSAPSQPIALPRRILLVEDDELVAESTMRLLESWGARVRLARSAEEARQLIEGERDGFDLALVDYRLPGSSGLEVIDRARARWPDLPAVLVTGDAYAGLVARSAGRGIPVLSKPIQPERLAAVLMDLRATTPR